MDFTETIAIVIASELAPSMVDVLIVISPGRHAGINTVLIGIYTCSWNDGVCDEGLDRLLLHIVQEMDHHLPTALHHAKDRRPLLRQCASAAWALESALTSWSALILYHLWLSCMISNHL